MFKWLDRKSNQLPTPDKKSIDELVDLGVLTGQEKSSVLDFMDGDAIELDDGDAIELDDRGRERSVYRIIDDFFPSKLFEELKSAIGHNDQPWFFRPNISLGDADLVSYGFSCNVVKWEERPIRYEKLPCTPLMYALHKKIMDEFGFKEVTRCRLDMTTYRGAKKHTFTPHIDIDGAGFTTILYLDESDAPTIVYKETCNDPEEVKYLTEKWINTAYWKQTGSKMPANPDKVLTGMDYHPKGHHFNLKRVSEFQPSPTITAMGSAETTAGAFHWNEKRKLTIPELKRIMSLPDDFILTGTWKQKAERCGRMVPPLMMKRLASSVYEKVLEKYNG